MPRQKSAARHLPMGTQEERLAAHESALSGGDPDSGGPVALSSSTAGIASNMNADTDSAPAAAAVLLKDIPRRSIETISRVHWLPLKNVTLSLTPTSSIIQQLSDGVEESCLNVSKAGFTLATPPNLRLIGPPQCLHVSPSVYSHMVELTTRGVLALTVLGGPADNIDVCVSLTTALAVAVPAWSFSGIPTSKVSTALRGILPWLCPPPVDTSRFGVRLEHEDVVLPTPPVFSALTETRLGAHLRPVLRPYQAAAVKWMVEREEGAPIDSGCPLNPLWHPAVTLDGSAQLFVCPLTGEYTLEAPSAAADPVLGGILADEMGLGKTVEMLACVIAHPAPVAVEEPPPVAYMPPPPRDDDDAPVPDVCICGHSWIESDAVPWVKCDRCQHWQHTICSGYAVGGAHPPFVCQSCSVSSPGMSSSSTLIICPATLLPQWRDEVARHTHGLTLAVYEGVKASLQQLSDRFRKIASLQCKAGPATHPSIAGCPHLAAMSYSLAAAPAPVPFQDDADDEEYVPVKRRRREKAPAAVTSPLGATVAALVSECTELSRRLFISHLAKFDIVLTTYEALSSDVNNVDLEAAMSRSMRRSKRYRVCPSPLLQVQWYRVCLDEAQVVENSLSRVHDMAVRLNARIRWSVTGTPIRTSYSDVFGLLDFLRLTPFCNPAIFKYFAARIEAGDTQAQRHVVQALRGVMRRVLKEQVREQLGIPPQTEETIQVSLSDIETVFYARQLTAAVAELQVLLSSWDDGTVGARTQLTGAEATTVFRALLRVRQACCHPQVAEGTLAQAIPMSMTAVLDSMLSKAKLEAEALQREVVFCLNARAGLSLLAGSTAAAASLYRDVLNLAAKHAPLFRLDPLQRLHAIVNLVECLDTLRAGPPVTGVDLSSLHCDHLRSEAAQIQTAVISGVSLTVRAAFTKLISDSCVFGPDAAPSLPPAAPSAAAHEGFALSPGEVDLFQSLLKRNEELFDCLSLWLAACVDWMKEDGQEGVFDAAISHVRARAGHTSSSSSTASTELVTMFTSCTSPDVLRAVALSSLRELGEARHRALAAILGRSGPKCASCTSRVTLQALRDKLTPSREGQVIAPIFNALDVVSEAPAAAGEDAEMSYSFSSPSPLLLLLSFLSKHCPGVDDVLASAKRLGCPNTSAVVEKVLRQLPLEAARLAKLWSAQSNLISAIDELGMCVLRFRLRAPGEMITAEEEGIMVAECEIGLRSEEYTVKQAAAERDLAHAVGHLSYLSSLATSGPRGSVDDLCLICQDPKSLEPELSLLPCGHSFCVDCAGLLYQQHKAAKTAKCPLCRKPFQPSAVAVVVVPPAASSSSSSSSAGPALSAPLIQGPPDAATASVPGMLGHVVKGASSLKVKGSHSSKIAALLSCVLELRRTEPSAKSIVFSQWEAVLDIVETALSQNRVPSLRPGSTKTPTKLTKLQDVVHLFCGEDSPAAVLLLPLAKAGKGINITAANHVFLIDATLTPDLDAQGIARVDRLGQTKPTFVHRFIASNTIEDTIFRLNRQYRTAHRGGVWVGRTPTGGEDVVCREDITLLLRTAQAALKKPTPEAASAPVVVE